MRLGSPFRRSGPQHSRHIVVLASLLGYLAALVGYPVSARVQLASEQPFPCQRHGCGCASAEQCWRSCCCFTPREKLAWARAHRVTPPAYADVGSDETSLAADVDDHDNDQGQQHHGCAAKHDHCAAYEHCAAHDASVQRQQAGGCEHCATGPGIAEHCAAGQVAAGQVAARQIAARQAPVAQGAEAISLLAQSVDEPAVPETGADTSVLDRPAEPGSRVRLVSSDAWRRCRGLPTLWVTSGAAIPPPVGASWKFSWVVIEWLSTAEATLYGGELLPPVPPPRV